jgi:recombination protein RecR
VSSPSPIARLVEELSHLPGVGPKTAQRLAMHLLLRPRSEALALAEAIVQARDRVRYCSICQNLTDIDPCAICRSPSRDQDVICVVEEPKDVNAMEKTREFRGVYHVLHGAISPLTGVGPDDLRIRELLARLPADQEPAAADRSTPPLREIILATDPDVEGDATALYLARLLKPLGVRITRIARGVPEGGDLDYVDEVTLSRALAGRADL